MRVFILTDLEGPAGVNGRPSDNGGIGNKILNPETARTALVNEVNACIRGLIKAGAESVAVVDGHGGSNNIDIFALHPAAELIQYGGFFYNCYPDGQYDAAIQIGAHAMQHTDGFMCHSFNSHSNSDMRLNGRQIGEIGIVALTAAWFHIPTILVSGDETACQEARDFLGDKIETVATKKAFSRYSVHNYSPAKIYAEMEAKAEKALRNLKKIPIVKIPAKINLEYEEMCPNQADGLECYGAQRIDHKTVRYTGNDFMQVWLTRWCAPNAVERVYKSLWDVRKLNEKNLKRTSPSHSKVRRSTTKKRS